jgi:hypothetical protein
MAVSRRLAVVVTALVTALAGVAVPGPAAADEPLPGGLYTPLPSPVRILDTRGDIGEHPAPVGPGETVTLVVPDLPADATAVALNVTGTGGSAATFLSVFPNQFAGTSTLNLTAGQTAAVAAFVSLGPKQHISLRNRNGTVHALVDVVGYFATGTGVGFTSAQAATRILDTRSALGGHPSALGPGEQVTLPVRGVKGVPADATAVVVNVSGVTPTSDTFLRVTPDGRPGTSTLNLTSGSIRANLAAVGIGADGAIRIQNQQGSTHVLADVQGWFGPGSAGRYVPLPAPRRVLDSRTAAGGGALGAGTTRTVSFAGTGVPAGGRTAVLFNLTGVSPTASTYLTAWPAGRTRPEASNVNLAAGAIVPNAAITDTATMNLFNFAGNTNVLVDAAGYFYAPTSATPAAPAAPAVTRVWNAGDRTGVAWTAPADGGLPITGYTVTAQPGGVTATVDGHVHELALGGLNPGTTYRITVSATNFAGTSPESAPSGPVTPSSMTRVDVGPTGTPDPGDRTDFLSVSGNGRYALLWVATDSPLTPAAYRTATDQGRYVVRKDLQTGEIVLVGMTEEHTPLRASWYSTAISWDGGTVVYGNADGPTVLHVHDLVAQVVRTVPAAPHEPQASFPALSRDGRWLTWATVDGQAGQSYHRQDLTTGDANVVLSCPDPGLGCYLPTAPAVADDGRTFLFTYRPSPGAPTRPTLLDADTGELRSVPEGDLAEGTVLSADGRWVYYGVGDGCPTCGGGTFSLRKVSTDPGATPVTVASWQDTVTWGVHPTSVSADGTLVAYFRQTGEAGQWYGTAPAQLYDDTTRRSVRLPAPRGDAYLGSATLSRDGSMAIADERCMSGASCGPTATFVVSTAGVTGR